MWELARDLARKLGAARCVSSKLPADVAWGYRRRSFRYCDGRHQHHAGRAMRAAFSVPYHAGGKRRLPAAMTVPVPTLAAIARPNPCHRESGPARTKKFAREHLKQAKIVVFPITAPSLASLSVPNADVMIRMTSKPSCSHAFIPSCAARYRDVRPERERRISCRMRSGLHSPV